MLFFDVGEIALLKFRNQNRFWSMSNWLCGVVYHASLHIINYLSNKRGYGWTQYFKFVLCILVCYMWRISWSYSCQFGKILILVRHSSCNFNIFCQVKAVIVFLQLQKGDTGYWKETIASLMHWSVFDNGIS